jgi:hypothetical protein
MDGVIGYFGLSDWFLSTFSPQERAGMEKLHSAGHDDSSVTLTTGDSGKAPPSESILPFLRGLAYEFRDFPSIAQRVLKKGLDSITPDTVVVEVHFFYATIIDIAYAQREKVPGAMETAIRFCEKQIDIAPSVMHTMMLRHEAAEHRLKGYYATMGMLGDWRPSPFTPPSHPGFKQLCIIREKERSYDEAIRLARLAQQQGWNGDWAKRIDRCLAKALRTPR